MQALGVGFACLSAGVLLAGSACCPPRPPTDEVIAEGAPAVRAGAARVPTRVVLAVVIDQLGSWTLERYLPYLPIDGAIRRGVERGVYVERVEYGYASTYTAPGHAAVHTGATPSDSGIVANEVQRGKRRQPMVSDGVHRVFGTDDATASPTMLRAETVADVMEKVSGGRAVTLSLAVKDRSAVLSGGKRPDLALWYDKQARRFTTSSYYMDAPPAWLDDWQGRHPIEKLFVPWQVPDPKQYDEAAGPDDAVGEGDWHGLGRTFPHDVGKTSQPYSVLRVTPQLTEHLLELAREAIERHDVGRDEVVDLVAVSIAATDYAGHVYGARSWEYLDNLVRADRALGELLTWLEGRSAVSVLVTSDHGSTLPPEQSPGEGGRIFEDELEKAMNDVAVDMLGKGRWVLGFVQPYFYLAPDIDPAARARVMDAIRTRVEAMEGVQALVPVSEALGWRDDPDPLRRAVGRSVAKDAGGDLYLVAKRGWLIDEDRASAHGGGHGSPWPSDREVPVVFWGPGVGPQRVTERLEQKRVATTLAALVGVSAPEHAKDVAPLPGAPRSEAVK